jgi:cysteinyl-tRNA synthetase
MQNPEEWIVKKTCDIDANKIDDLIKQRNKARIEKNWAEADKIRYLLDENNIVLYDDKDGNTTWSYK